MDLPSSSLDIYLHRDVLIMMQEFAQQHNKKKSLTSDTFKELLIYYKPTQFIKSNLPKVFQLLKEHQDLHHSAVLQAVMVNASRDDTGNHVQDKFAQDQKVHRILKETLPDYLKSIDGFFDDPKIIKKACDMAFTYCFQGQSWGMNNFSESIRAVANQLGRPLDKEKANELGEDWMGKFYKSFGGGQVVNYIVDANFEKAVQEAGEICAVMSQQHLDIEIVTNDQIHQDASETFESDGFGAGRLGAAVRERREKEQQIGRDTKPVNDF